VIQLVDAAEGPMPQTKFVTQKALGLGLRPIVVINKADKPDARPDAAHEEVFDLFAALGADDGQLDFPLLYAAGRDGWAVRDLADPRADLSALFDTILNHIPEPRPVREGRAEAPFAMLASLLERDQFLGRVLTGRIEHGRVATGMRIHALDRHGAVVETGRVSKLLSFQGLERVPDGKSFLFVSDRGSSRQLYRKPVGEGAAEQLTKSEQDVRDPAVSPDGRSVAFVEVFGRLGKVRKGRVKLLSLKDGSVRTLLPDVHVLEKAFSPDGKTLAVSHGSGLDLVDVKNGKSRRIDWRAVDAKMYAHGAWNLCWCPDGTKIACRITFLGGREAGGGPIRGDDTLFVFDPRKETIELSEIALPVGFRRGPLAWRRAPDEPAVAK